MAGPGGPVGILLYTQWSYTGLGKTIQSHLIYTFICTVVIYRIRQNQTISFEQNTLTKYLSSTHWKTAICSIKSKMKLSF